MRVHVPSWTVRAAFVAATVVAGSVLLVPPPPASACSCVAQTDAQALAGADVVFSGRLVGDSGADASAPGSSGDPRYLLFAVDRVYKGDVAARQEVVTASSDASCGLTVDGPGPFLVFASTGAGVVVGHDDELQASSCGGTHRFTAVPAGLGPGTPVAEAVAPAPPERADGAARRSVVERAGTPGLAPFALGVAVGATVIVGVSSAIIRRRRRSAPPA